MNYIPRKKEREEGGGTGSRGRRMNRNVKILL